MAYGDFKDLNRRAAVDKVVHDKAFSIAENPKYDGGWCMVNIGYTFQWSINFLIKKNFRWSRYICKQIFNEK